MNKEEITKALEIIRKPITVNCIDYHYFDNENYNDLVRVYENCLWFINNVEQIIETSNQLQQRINKAIEYIKNKWYSKNTRNIEELYSLGNWQIELLEILGGKE